MTGQESLCAALPGAALLDPAVNVPLTPDAAGRKLADGLGEALGSGELVGSLLADAQEGGDLCDSNEFHLPEEYPLTVSSARPNIPLDNVKGGTMDLQETYGREFIGHKRGLPPHCDRCDEESRVTFASWWHAKLNLYLCDKHSDAEATHE